MNKIIKHEIKWQKWRQTKEGGGEVLPRKQGKKKEEGDLGFLKYEM